MQHRHVPLQGSANFRDLGGYPTRDGRTTRWRRFFRSDTLHALTPGDVAALQDLGVTTVVDLRTSVEVRRDGVIPGAGTWVTWHHVPLTEEQHNPQAPEVYAGTTDLRLHERYQAMALAGAPRLVEALERLAGAASGPAGGTVFHCAAGKDRTGMIAAVLLDLAGVPDPVIARDYLETNRHLPGVYERLSRIPAYALEQQARPDLRLGVREEFILGFLESLRQGAGSVERFLTEAGLDPGAPEALRNALLEDRG